MATTSPRGPGVLGAAWEICRKDLRIELVLRELPKDWQDALTLANRQFEAWTPTPEQVAQLARSLESLPPIDPNRYVRHAAKLIAPDQYEAAQLDAGPIPLDGSVAAMRLHHAFRPRPRRRTTRPSS